MMKKKKLFGCRYARQTTPAVEVAPAVETGTDYATQFVQQRKLTTRQCVYISHDVHTVIAKLVRVLANTGNEVTIGAYIDTVLTVHLQSNKDAINEICRQQEGDLL